VNSRNILELPPANNKRKFFIIKVQTRNVFFNLEFLNGGQELFSFSFFYFLNAFWPPMVAVVVILAL